MHNIHRLLRRQLKRYFKDADAVPWEWVEFVRAVNDAYVEFEAGRQLIDRSLELSSQELLQANSEIRGVLDVLPDLLFRIDGADKVVDMRQPGSALSMHPLDPLLTPSPENTEASLRFTEAVAHVRRVRAALSFEYMLSPH